MLVLSRKVSQQIRIGSDISITVVKIDRNQVRLGITAPNGLTILRDELIDPSNERFGTDEFEVRVAPRKSTDAGRMSCTAVDVS